MNKDEKEMIEGNEYEMIKRLQSALPDAETMRFNFDKIDLATYLYDAGCRKIADDEIVIKKQAYEKFVEEFAKQEEIAHSYEQGHAELLEANHQLQDELEKTKQQTARDILQEILYTKSCEEWFENEQLVDFGKKIVDKIENLANKYGIDLE